MKITVTLQYGALLITGASAIAFGGSPPDNGFPIIGGSYGQTARLLVAGDGSVRCSITAGFRTGETSPPEPDRTFDLAPGQTAFTDVSLSRLAGRLGRRVELLPFVKVHGGKCSASVEVFEQFTGRNTAYMRLFAGLGAPPEGDTPVLGAPPDDQFPAISAVLGQVVRLGLSAKGFDPQPDPPVQCVAVLSFADARGNAAGPTKAVNLAPGQFDFIDFRPAVAFGQRAIVQPRLLLPASGGGDLRGCDGSVQVFEQATGWTSEIVKGR